MKAAHLFLVSQVAAVLDSHHGEEMPTTVLHERTALYSHISSTIFPLTQGSGSSADPQLPQENAIQIDAYQPSGSLGTLVISIGAKYTVFWGREAKSFGVNLTQSGIALSV